MLTKVHWGRGCRLGSKAVAVWDAALPHLLLLRLLWLLLRLREALESSDLAAQLA